MLTWKITENNPLTASGSIPISPPPSWFEPFTSTRAIAVEITPEGRIFGHVARRGLGHISPHPRLNGRQYPFGRVNYSKFATGSVLCDNGDSVKTGRLVMGMAHPELQATGISALEAYDHSGAAVADVAVYEDSHGLAIVGAVRPSASESFIRIARASDWSIDVRNNDLVGLLAVNVSGYPIEAGSDDDYCLVASGGAPRHLITDDTLKLETNSGETFAGVFFTKEEAELVEFMDSEIAPLATDSNVHDELNQLRQEVEALKTYVREQRAAHIKSNSTKPRA